jgi:hypothetical protein
MSEELKILEKNKLWILVALPKGKKDIRYK